MNTPSRVSFEIYKGSNLVFRQSYYEDEAKMFWQNDEIHLPDKYYSAMVGDIWNIGKLHFEECSLARLIVSLNDIETIYICEDLSQEELEWKDSI